MVKEKKKEEEGEKKDALGARALWTLSLAQKGRETARTSFFMGECSEIAFAFSECNFDAFRLWCRHRSAV